MRTTGVAVQFVRGFVRGVAISSVGMVVIIVIWSVCNVALGIYPRLTPEGYSWFILGSVIGLFSSWRMFRADS